MRVVRPKFWKSPYLNDIYSGKLKLFSYSKLQTILNLSGAQDGNKVALEIGCGMGYFLPTLLKYFKKVFALDENRLLGHSEQENKVFVDESLWPKEYIGMRFFGLIQKFLEVEKTKVDDKLELLEKEQIIEIDENSIDCCFSIDVFEHVKDRQSVYKQIGRLIKNDGVLIYSVPNTTGIMYLVRQMAGLLLGVKEDPSTDDHKNYNWKKDLILLKKYFKIKKILGFPFYFPTISPSIIVKCTPIDFKDHMND